LSVTFTPTDPTSYTTVTKTVQISVTQAAPVITWSNPASIVFGTALSATQLNATASVPGNLVYTPAAGAIPAAGTRRLSSSTQRLRLPEPWSTLQPWELSPQLARTHSQSPSLRPTPPATPPSP